MTLPNRTFGIEIEIKGLGTNEAHQALVAAGIDAQLTGYTHRTTACWKVLYDGSLTGTSCEVVSPVLSGETGIEAVCKVARTLSSAGARIDRQCGLHVHVGTNGLSANDVAMILARYARFESTIDCFMPRSRRGSANMYCREISSRARRLHGRAFTSISDVQRTYGGGERYLKVNMESYSRHRTIEFRQHSGTVNATKIENWIRFILGFVEASVGQSITVGTSTAVAARPRRSGRIRRNSMDAKLDAVILAFRARPAQRLSVSQIAATGGWSEASVSPYITRLRQDRGCQIRKVRGTNYYILIGNSGRLSSDTAATPAPVVVETRSAARRVQGVGDIANDSVFRGIPAEVVSFYEERAQDLAN